MLRARRRARRDVLRARNEGMLLRGAAAVVGLSIDQLVAWGVLYYAYTVLSHPIAADLGVSRLYVAGTFSACLLTASWASRRVGARLDQRGTRGVLRLGAVVAPPIFAAIALVQSAATLVVAFVALGLAQSLSLYEPAFRTLVAWYPEARARSRAMLALTSVGGFASTLFLPVTGWLTVAFGWRLAVIILAALLAFVILPLRLALPLTERGVTGAEEPVVAPAHRSEALLALGLSAHSFASTGVFVYLMWHLVESGASPVTAAGIAGLAGAAQVPGRLAVIPFRRVIGDALFLALPLLLTVQALALLGVVLGAGPLATASVLLFGAANGMMTLERAAVLVEWYGPTTFGTRQGRLASATGVARAVSPFIVEAGHHIASYRVVFGILALTFFAGASACVVAARARSDELALA